MLYTKHKHNLGGVELGNLILEGSGRKKKGMIFINLLKPIIVFRIKDGGKLFKV